MTSTYIHFETGKIRKTKAKFVKWSEPTGPLSVRYALFRRPKGWLCVPEYCLTKETRQAIDQEQQ